MNIIQNSCSKTYSKMNKIIAVVELNADEIPRESSINTMSRVEVS